MYAQNLELIEKGTCPMSFYLIKQDPNSNCSKASVSGAQDCDYGADVLLCHLSVAFEFSFSEKDWSMHSTHMAMQIEPQKHWFRMFWCC